MIDFHIHTYFSPDAHSKPEEFLALNGSDSFVMTEHLDFDDKRIKFDSVFHLVKYFKKVEDLRKKFPNKIYTGVELGFQEMSKQKIDLLFSTYEFDIVLLSIHCNSQYDYLFTPEGYSVDCDEYFQIIIDGLNYLPNVLCLTHIDYPFRKNAIPKDLFSNPKLLEVWKTLIDKNIALEVNTSSLYFYNNEKLYLQFLESYYNYGGRKVSFGSDAHHASQFKLKFDETVEKISKIGDFEIINFDY